MTHAHKDYDKYDSSDRYHDNSDRYSDRYYDTRYHDRHHNHGYEYPRYDYKKSGYNYNIKHDRDANFQEGTNSYQGANFHKPYHRDRYQSYNHGKEESKYESEVIKVHDSHNRLSNSHSSDHPFMNHLITDKLDSGVIIQPESSTEDGAEEEEESEEVFDDRPRFVGRGTVEINNNKAIFSCFLFDAKYEMTSVSIYILAPKFFPI